MKSVRITLSLVLLLAATAFAQDAQKAFDQLKTLNGTWEGKASNGHDLKVSFRPTAGGSAAHERNNGRGRYDHHVSHG